MKLVNGFANELDKDQVLILSQYANNRDYHNYVRINRVKLPLYDVRDSILIDSVLEQPYMFVLDKDMVCNNFYVPYKETPNLVKQYLKMIKNVIN
ncbi:MAG: hypothetical protein MJ211_07290 [Bacteroidales bacterium]|nr:hypothetical protein [Bacteroidales bacterium]